MVKINFIVLFFIFLSPIVCAQRVVVSDSVVFSGVVFDTLQLSEALILRRWGEVQRQNLINARNNMTGILKQAYAPVDYMDADMNQRMMLNEYARSVEMKGHVDVGIGVGTQSVDAYKMFRMRRRVKNQKEWLNPNEIDLLKKIYYLKKKEKQDN